MYRRAHCCSDVAKRPHVRPVIKLKNQRELTQTTYPDGENGGGRTPLESTDVRGVVSFESARI